RATRDAAGAWRRPAHRHRAPATARRAQGPVRRAKLLRRVAARAGTEPGARALDHGRAPYPEAVGHVRPAISPGNAPAARRAAARHARGTLRRGKLLRRLLLRGRSPVSPVGAAAVIDRAGRADRSLAPRHRNVPGLTSYTAWYRPTSSSGPQNIICSAQRASAQRRPPISSGV